MIMKRTSDRLDRTETSRCWMPLYVIFSGVLRLALCPAAGFSPSFSACAALFRWKTFALSGKTVSSLGDTRWPFSIPQRSGTLSSMAYPQPDRPVSSDALVVRNHMTVVAPVGRPVRLRSRDHQRIGAQPRHHGQPDHSIRASESSSDFSPPPQTFGPSCWFGSNAGRTRVTLPSTGSSCPGNRDHGVVSNLEQTASLLWDVRPRGYS